jgi:preprotein translocase subunit SecA
MFEELMHSIWEEFSKLIFHVEVDIAPADAEQAFAAPGDAGDMSYSGGTADAQPSALAEVAAAGSAGAVEMAAAEATEPAGGPGGGNGEVVETVVKSDREKIGRNDPCWCGSGKKYKKCHGA